MAQVGVKEASFICESCQKCVYENATGPVCPECAEMYSSHEMWGEYTRGLASIEEYEQMFPYAGLGFSISARVNLRERCFG